MICRKMQIFGHQLVDQITVGHIFIFRHLAQNVGLGGLVDGQPSGVEQVFHLCGTVVRFDLGRDGGNGAAHLSADRFQFFIRHGKG
ncbi:hypothetical protein SDC9_143089 [bioreactor metagenome]|uniref:Uncharacterized protein n=1 Tax=bioreactor metagenome TaxID=1076179 RepID=A0A645E544_9ZZZZ